MIKGKIYHIDQNTPEWLSLRLGLPTASMFGTIMANYPKAFGDPAKKYAQKLAIERVTNRQIETYTNEHMSRGHEQEPEARLLYEKETGVTASPGGFCSNGECGASSDGLINEDGMIEIKSVLYNIQMDRIRKGGYDPRYKWQIHGNLALYGREWCDFISYCPDMPEKYILYIQRVEPDIKLINMLKTRLSDFEELIEKNVELIS